ncbi:response regulator transcription factor [Kribbella albertanoniae]|uniref:Response regulator transcription factor n=1 Tax=Kribbella albertanoniae TaxID=1266829 RepID=A0A4R4P0Y0_9ACTN|nr:response regulator transcription factor [Kribbella albertanoniae]TDC15489.1 response regulator transcription factor [Kribbella albertanoniae]
MTRLLIVDDEALVRAGLKMILESDSELEVVAEADDGADAAAMVTKHRPDVVLMDIRMPRLDGLAATRAVQALPDPPKVVVLTTFDLDDYVFRALQAGASGFLLKDTPPRELVQAIKVVAAGDAMLSPAVTRRLIGHYAKDSRADRRRVGQERVSKLTEREREVLVEVGSGLPNADIGKKLFMSEATVKAHVSRLLVKLSATNRVQAAIIAYEAGLLTDD